MSNEEKTVGKHTLGILYHSYISNPHSQTLFFFSAWGWLLQPCGCSVYSAVLGLSVSALPRENHLIGSCRLIVPVSWLVYRTLKVMTSLPHGQSFAILWSEQLVFYSAEFWWEVVFREWWDCENCLLCLFCVWLYQRYTGLFGLFDTDFWIAL